MQLAVPDDAPPAELRIGACVEVWSSEHCAGWPPAFSASRRHGSARRAWAHERGLGTGELCRVMPARAPWSVERLVGEGQRAEVEERLARAGISVADLPGLRAKVARLYPPDPEDGP